MSLPPGFLQDLRLLRATQRRYFGDKAHGLHADRSAAVRREAQDYERAVDLWLTRLSHIHSPVLADTQQMRFWQKRFFAGEKSGEVVGSAKKYERRVDTHLDKTAQSNLDLALFSEEALAPNPDDWEEEERGRGDDEETWPPPWLAW